MSGTTTDQILLPTSAQDVADAVCVAIDHGGTISSSRFADVGDAGARRLDLRNMSAVVDYPARDMTITVQAGMPVGTLAEILAAEKQQLPLDWSEDAVTVGALVASNTAGPRQFAYGTVRDYLIGLEAVDGQGRIFHAGGRVVKNVAGYDLCRLLVGSRGSLGILTQLTFKLKPIADHCVGIAFLFDDAEAVQLALERLNVTAATPVILDFAMSAGAASCTLSLAVEGSEQACQWQIEQLQQDCAGAAVVDFGDTSAGSVADYCQRADFSWPGEAVRIQTLPSSVIKVAQALSRNGHAVRGHAGNGIVYVSGDGEQLRAECESLVATHSGTVTQWHSDHPSDATDGISIRLRQAFDPHSVFSK